MNCPKHSAMPDLGKGEYACGCKVVKPRKRSGISGDRAYRIQRALVQGLSNIFSMARCFHFTHEDITSRCLELYAHARSRKAPRHTISYAQGYEEAKRQEVWHRDLVWMLWCDGRLMTSKEVNDLAAKERGTIDAEFPGYRSPWCRIDNERSRHVWTSSDGKPLTDCSFDAKFRTQGD